jgi:hypothetical protein
MHGAYACHLVPSGRREISRAVRASRKMCCIANPESGCFCQANTELAVQPATSVGHGRKSPTEWDRRG